ncbi:MAG: hypothetical protein L6420_06705 [Elusimicrobia bacterium]|nr:hypothetical protein [Elusimicrobiota bacterium]
MLEFLFAFVEKINVASSFWVSSQTGIIIGGWIAAGLTIFMFSFLYKDNPFFKIAEHLYLGAGMGWLFQVSFFNVWLPKVWEPLRHGDYIVLIPALLGLSLIAQFVPKISWISRYGFTFAMGYGAGLAIPVELSTNFLAQISGTIVPLFCAGKPVFTGAALWSAFNSFFIFFGLVCVLFYFFFSLEHKGVVKKASNIGIYFLMLYFGAVFGNTVMGRFSLLFGRFDDLYNYSGANYFYASNVILVILVAFFIISHFKGKKNKTEVAKP